MVPCQPRVPTYAPPIEHLTYSPPAPRHHRYIFEEKEMRVTAPAAPGSKDKKPKKEMKMTARLQVGW
jgi:hypothetical protein